MNETLIQEERQKLLVESKNNLVNQTLDESKPGIILREFNKFLNLVKEDGIEVSGKNSLFPQKLLPELNLKLTTPTLTDLKRPVQKSYPYLNGIYLLLRTTGLTYVIREKRKQKLVLDQTVYQSWEKLNLTEQYLTLLEAWLIHAQAETIAEKSYEPNFLLCIRFWQTLPKDSLKLTKKNQGYFAFNYSLKHYNLALLDLFGLIELEQRKPEKGKSWNISKIVKTTYGKSLLLILLDSLLSDPLKSHSNSRKDLFQLLDELEEKTVSEFGKLQPILQTYFPQWQNNLIIPSIAIEEGIYIFKVSLGNCWRQIAIPSHLDLESLVNIILDVFDFDKDHLYQFKCKQRTGKTLKISHPYLEDNPPFTDEFTIGELPLQEGDEMTFKYDFGDNWEFKLNLEKINPPDKKLKKPKLLKSYGTAPEQYNYDEDEEW